MDGGQAGPHSLLYSGCPIASPEAFTMYRWHLPDPVLFHRNIKVTLQQLGGRKAPAGGWELYERSDDLSAAAFWYQQGPAQAGRAYICIELTKSAASSRL